MPWLLDLLQTVAGGVNRLESLSRSPVLQLRGECRPLLALKSTAEEGEAAVQKYCDKLRQMSH